MNKIEVRIERCKGCYLCIEACPKDAIAISESPNAAGCYPVMQLPDGVCTACGQCALVCPDAAITVLRGVVEEDLGDRPS